MLAPKVVSDLIELNMGDMMVKSQSVIMCRIDVKSWSETNGIFMTEQTHKPNFLL